MGSTFGDECILQQLSLPGRRDYQLRSYSVKASDNDSNKSLSPWVPRSQFPTRATTFRFQHDEPPALDRAFFSGPLPSLIASDDVDFLAGPQSFYRRQWSDGSLPGTPEVGSSPEHSIREPKAANSEDDIEDDDEEPSYLTTADENCMPAHRAEETSIYMPPLYSSYHESFGMRPTPASRSRNCVSGELSLGCKLPPRIARRCVSGEIGNVDSRGGATCGECGSVARSGNRERDGGVARRVVVGEAIVGDNNRAGRSSAASSAWDRLNELRIDSPNRGATMAAIPFEWEEAPGKARETTKKAYSRTSSSQSRRNDRGLQEAQLGRAVEERSFGSSHRYYGRSEKAESGRWSEAALESSDLNLVAPAAAKFLKETVASSSPNSPQKVVPAAVPFKWEEAPGKPKFEDTAAAAPAAQPALQLPPRLASTSLKNDHPLTRRRAAATARSRHTNRSLSAPFSVLFPDGSDAHPSQEDEAHYWPAHDANRSRQTIAGVCHSGPLENVARPSDFAPWRGSSGPHSGPISHASHFGLPQYQSADLLCETSDAWQRLEKRCSPTSTLCGPGSDGPASQSIPSSSSENDHRKSNAPDSNSQSSTSHESFERWSYGEHVSPTSRFQSAVDFDAGGGHGSPYVGPAKAHEEVPKSPRSDAIVKLCRKLKLTTTKLKPVTSPNLWSPAGTLSPRPMNLNAGAAHEGEEFYDCPGSSSSSPLQTDYHATNDRTIPPPQLLLEAPTRLPYKMPPAPQEIDVRSECNSPGRSLTDFSNCLGVPISLPRFLTKCDTADGGIENPCFWVENPSWDPPTSYLEDGYRSPAYRATLELLSPSDDLMAKRSESRRSRSLKLASSSLRRTQTHIVEVLCNSLRQTLLRCTKRSCERTNSLVIYDDQFLKRHQSHIW